MEEMVWQASAIGWGLVYVVVGAVLGAVLVLCVSVILPRLLDKFTPSIDEQMEIVRGNQAVAEYFGRIVAAGILGMSIVVAAAVLGGLIAALH